MHSQDLTLDQACPAASIARRGFTLTELLVVIAIIAMLAALVSVAVVRALDTARQTAMKSEVDQIDSAFKAYKEKYGSYPPCDWRGLGGNSRLRQHIAMAFPRYDLNNLNNDLRAAIGAGGTEWQKFRPDMALVFWLSGFSADPTAPFVSPDGFQIKNGTVTAVKVQRTPFFAFDTTRLTPVDSTGAVGVNGATGSNVSCYFPKGVKADTSGAPYLYWDASSYQALLPDPPMSQRLVFNCTAGAGLIFTNAGVATPYVLDANNNSTIDMTENWANPESFQLIASGGDGKYGFANATPTDRARLYPTGTGYDTSTSLADDDNVTNFAQAARLGDAKP